MRANVLLRITTAVGIVALLFVVSSTAAVAQVDPCIQACMDQMEADVQECDDELMAKLDDLKIDEQACVDQAPTSPNGAKGCFTSVNKRRRNAQKQHSQCLRRADNKYKKCKADCDASPI